MDEHPERPNYRLRYGIECRDDHHIGNYDFLATTAQEAQRMAAAFILSRDTAEAEAVENGNLRWTDRCHYKPLSLNTLDYVIREDIEETPIPLEERRLERTARGE